MKIAIVLSALVFCASAMAADDIPNFTVLKGKKLPLAMDQTVTMCASNNMEIVQQTKNTVVCHLLTTTIRYTLVQLSTGVRVSWSVDKLVYEGIPVENQVTNSVILAVLLEAGKSL